MKKRTFVLNDETKLNAYGFRVLNKGVDLKRFLANSVMLNQHENSTASVLGKWENVRVEGSLLLADADFDEEDEDAKKIATKVDKGYIKGVSIGFSYREADMRLDENGDYVLTACELFEASICAIPANANSVKLYHPSGELLNANEIKLSLQNVTPKSSIMKKMNLSIAALFALGFNEQLSEGDDAKLSEAIEKLQKENQTLKAKVSELEGSAKAQAELSADKVVSEALSAGKLTAEDVPYWKELAIKTPDRAKAMLDAIPAKINLGASVNNPAAPTAIKTLDEFEKLSLQEQLAFKVNHPEEYKKLFA